jgi:hypothetical protein
LAERKEELRDSRVGLERSSSIDEEGFARRWRRRWEMLLRRKIEESGGRLWVKERAVRVWTIAETTSSGGGGGVSGRGEG